MVFTPVVIHVDRDASEANEKVGLFPQSTTSELLTEIMKQH